MAVDTSESQEADLERTDRLPILNLAGADDDVADDAVRLEMTPRPKADFPRSSNLDLPALAESVRSMEERIARQGSDYEALSRSHDAVRAAEAAGTLRARALAEELAALRAHLASEQARTRQLDKALADATEAARSGQERFEEALRNAERYQGEARTLRDTLVARDATIAQVLHSLGERDAQLSALQREHARLVPALEERSRAGVNLEGALRAAVARAEATALELRTSQAAVATLAERIKASEVELNSARRELSGVKTLAATHLERLRTREWRRGFDLNLFRELDAKVGAFQSDHGAQAALCDQLRQQVGELESKLTLRDEAIARLRAAVVDEEARRARHETTVSQGENARHELMQQIAALDGERIQLASELSSKDQALADALAAGKRELQLVQDKLAMADQTHAALRAEVGRLEADLRARDDERAVLQAHLQAARRPLEPIEAEVTRMMEELAAKSNALDKANDENRTLRSALERARGALEEREFLIRRLERSETNNANVLGRIQNSIERIGAGPGLSAGTVKPAECTAEIVRMDGDVHTTHVLGRRTRIGRAPGCEIQIESSSVSRHHALVLVGMREIIIEDLNSTNGVLVNGRKVSRQLLSDGDLLTIGEAHFKLHFKPAQRAVVAPQTPAMN